MQRSQSNDKPRHAGHCSGRLIPCSEHGDDTGALFVHQGVDEPHRVLRTDIVVQRFRQEKGLRAVVAGEVRHAAIYRPAPSSPNPLRFSFHTVCLISETMLARTPTAEARPRDAGGSLRDRRTPPPNV